MKDYSAFAQFILGEDIRERYYKKVAEARAEHKRQVMLKKLEEELQANKMPRDWSCKECADINNR